MDLICKDIDAYFDLPLVCILALRFLSQATLCVKFSAVLWAWFDRTAGVDLLLWINIYKHVKQHCRSRAMASDVNHFCLVISCRPLNSVHRGLLPVSRKRKQLPFWVYFTATLVVPCSGIFSGPWACVHFVKFRKIANWKTDKRTFRSPFQWTFMRELWYSWRPMGGVGLPFTNSECVVGSFACHVSWAEHAASHIVIVDNGGSVN